MTFLRIFLNEISLLGASNREIVHRAMIELMNARRASRALSKALYCSRQTATIEAVKGEQLIVSISNLPKDYRNIALIWLTRNGPFLDDDREVTVDDLYHLEAVDVTDFGPGEAARQIQRQLDASLFSFKHRQDYDFSQSMINIIHGLKEEPIAIVPVPNLSGISDATKKAEAMESEPESWEELVSFCIDRFKHLLIGQHCLNVLRPLPFYPNVSRRTVELCAVLDKLSKETDENGSLTSAGNDIVQSHFVGEKAWFTGESDENMRMFAREMTFPDPENTGKHLQCFWHGKIKTPQFRIHFEWPRLKTQSKIKVVYIGPKISKK